MGATNTTKRCKAGFDHAAVKADATAFSLLKFVGRQHTPADEYGPEELLELRDCPCSSTLAIDVSHTLQAVAA